jgi:hypothetical protein
LKTIRHLDELRRRAGMYPKLVLNREISLCHIFGFSLPEVRKEESKPPRQIFT